MTATSSCLVAGWCLRSESNQRHKDFQSSALPTELQRQVMATRMGLEPTTSAVTGRRSNQLSYQAITGGAALAAGGNNRARTYDPLLVRQMLSQLSYAPIRTVPSLATARVIITGNYPFVNRFFGKISISFAVCRRPQKSVLPPRRALVRTSRKGQKATLRPDFP